MDVRDDLAAGPLGLIQNPGANQDNPTHTAGMTFIGQFIDHDLTLDATSPLGTPTKPEATINGARPPSTSTRSTAPGRSATRCSTRPTSCA